VRDSAELLRGSVGHYLFVSSGSVYSDPDPGFDESAPTAELTEPDTEDVMAHYGALKAACERVVSEVFPDEHTNARSGLIVGPHDPTGRFTYWPLRVAAGGELLAPAPPERAVQFIDVRDLAEWMVEACDQRHVGTFNATGEQVRFDEFLVGCGDADPVWVSDEFLLEHEVEPFSELPLWIPGSAAAFLQADVSEAVGAGLRFRPLGVTVRDTRAWADEAGEQLVTDRGLRQGRAGLDPAKEAELLEAWRAR